MKNLINTVTLILILITVNSCTELDLVPQDKPSTAPFVSIQQFREGLNEAYREAYYPFDKDTWAGFSDDENYRTSLAANKAGTISSDYGFSSNRWAWMYAGIARILSVKKQILEQEGVLTETDAKVFLAEADFAIANMYSYLVDHFGDVPFFDEPITQQEAFEMVRTDKSVVTTKIYELLDNAIANLPETRSGLQYATKGAAMAMKARAALYKGDFAVAAEAAKACMDLGIYELHPDFGDLFLTKTRSSNELIFYIPRDETKDIVDVRYNQVYLPRGQGGWAAKGPTWDFLAAFECVDGLPIDESTLFDPNNPFKNRDPRCAYSIVPFGSQKEGDGLTPKDGSEWLARELNMHPEVTEIMDYATGMLVKNNNVKSVTPHSNYAGMLMKKWIDDEWFDRRDDGNRIVMRYADVLLMYAEAKIELNQIDASVLKAINDVRDRAYANSDYTNPAVTTTDQTELRIILRRERRVELAFESTRVMDLIRWRLAEKVFNRPIYGLLADGTFFTKVDGVVTIKPGDWWFWPLTPEIDDDGIADFGPMVDAGFASEIAQMSWSDNQYLWPIPVEEILLAPGLTQNSGY